MYTRALRSNGYRCAVLARMEARFGLAAADFLFLLSAPGPGLAGFNVKMESGSHACCRVKVWALAELSKGGPRRARPDVKAQVPGAPSVEERCRVVRQIWWGFVYEELLLLCREGSG